MTRTILITGAGGRIGRYLTKRWKDEYNLILTDIRKPDETYNFPFTQANLTDMDALLGLCEGVDTLIHLGADPRMEAPWESLLPNNVIGTYNAFEAAHRAGCRRMVYASSINAVYGYPADVQVHEGMPIRPPNVYGATKVWGEALARVYSDIHGLSTICLRFGGVLVEESERPDHDDSKVFQLDNPNLDMILTMRDLGQLVTRSVEAPDTLRYGVYHGISNNRWKRLDITNARQDLGYEPEDDAFALARALMSQVVSD